LAERRMFAKTIIDSDAFLDMPLSAQSLYFHLSMRADDDGFINNPQKIRRVIGASEDDLKLLIAKRFIIPFDSGVVVIKHWKIHNYIQSDRYKETVYREEKTMLEVKPNKAYTLKKNNELEGKTQCIQNVYSLDTQVRLGKDSIDKDSIDKDSIIEDKSSMSVETDTCTTLNNKKTYPDITTQINEFTSDSELKEILNEFVAMRKKARKPLTNYAMYLVLKKLSKETNDIDLQKDLLNQSILNSWLDIYPLKKDYVRKYGKDKKVLPKPDWYDDYQKQLKEASSKPNKDDKINPEITDFIKDMLER